MKRLLSVRLSIWILTLCIMLVIAGLALILPTSRATLARWLVGEPAAIPMLGTPDPAHPIPPPDAILSLTREPLIATPPLDAASSTLLSLEQAQSQTSFTIQMPSVLPNGYHFLGVMPTLRTADMGIPMPPPPVSMLIFVNDSGQRLTFTQIQPVESNKMSPPQNPDQGNVQQVTVNGAQGYYVEGIWTRSGWVKNSSRRLYWQDKAGVTYDFNGVDLNLETLLASAQSLK